MESILNSIKKKLNIASTYEHFDEDVIIEINSALMILDDLGVGDNKGFTISDATAVWSDFIKDIKLFAAVKSYVYLKAKLVFDPPQTGPLVEAIERRVAEFEWRLNVRMEEVKKNADD